MGNGLEGGASEEIILAEEEAVINRGVGVRQEIESGFDLGRETEGNLVLTNLRLVYVHGGEREVALPVGTVSKKRLFISDVEDLESIPADAANITIVISSIESVKGHHAPGMAPRLEVRWNHNGVIKRTEFVEQETGRSREKNLNDWAPIIERLKDGTQSITLLPPPPDSDSLEGRILLTLADMQEKGVLTIEQELEKRFTLELDPEQVEQACENLVSQGLVQRTSPKAEGAFYVKISPLGEDDLNR